MSSHEPSRPAQASSGEASSSRAELESWAEIPDSILDCVLRKFCNGVDAARLSCVVSWQGHCVRLCAAETRDRWCRR